MPDDPKQLAERYEPKPVTVIKPDRQVYRLRFSPCGSLLFGAGLDASVRRWDASTDEFTELPALTGHHGWVSAVAVHPTGKRLFTADSWGALRCWSYEGDKPKPLWSHDQAHDGWLRSVVVSPDGETLATCGRDLAVRLWSCKDGKPRGEWKGHEHDVYALAFSPDGKALVSADDRGVVKQWDVKAGKPVRELDASKLYLLSRLQDVGGLRGLTFSDDGKRLIVGGAAPSRGATVQGKPTLLLFDFESGKLDKTLEVGENKDCFLEDLVVHPDGFIMAVTSGTPGTGKLVFVRPADDKPFFQNTKLPNGHAVALAPGARRFAVAVTNGGSNGNGRRLNKDGEYQGNHSPIHVFDLPTGDGEAESGEVEA